MEEINFIRPQEVFNRNTGESKVRYTSYDGSNKFIPVVDGEDGVPRTLVVTTHAELKAMRDAGKLTPGALYRITDYQCTTTQKNTRSAGHQFDIVLLALSEHKLAEEGWAMMHETLVFKVTFSNSVIEECYLRYLEDNGGIYILVSKSRLLGYDFAKSEFESISTIDWENKLITVPFEDSVLSQNIEYNYFQNSNLSAWKVWYCLDNDKSRFSWADDSVDEDSPAMVGRLPRYPVGDKEIDNVQYYCWGSRLGTITYDSRFTTSETPNVGDALYKISKNSVTLVSTITSFTPAHEGTGLPNGRGVIYRLIDEWNNDIKYDFKNIQFKRTVNEYNVPDVQAQDEEYFYTFSLINNGDNYKILDASIFAKHFLNDENGEGRCNNNYISSIDEYTAGLSVMNKFTLSNIILVGAVEQYNNTSFIAYNRFKRCRNITLLGNKENLTFSDSTRIVDDDFVDMYNTIVLTTWDKTITSYWAGNIIKMEGQTLKKVSFVNL